MREMYLERIQTIFHSINNISIQEFAEIDMIISSLRNYEITNIKYLFETYFDNDNIKELLKAIKAEQNGKNTFDISNIFSLCNFGIMQIRTKNSFYLMIPKELGYTKETLSDKRKLLDILDKNPELNVLTCLWTLCLFTEKELNNYFIIELSHINTIRTTTYVVTDHRLEYHITPALDVKGNDLLFYFSSIINEDKEFIIDYMNIERISSNGLFNLINKNNSNRINTATNQRSNISNISTDVVCWNIKRFFHDKDDFMNTDFSNDYYAFILRSTNILRVFVDDYKNFYSVDPNSLFRTLINSIFINHSFNVSIYMRNYKSFFTSLATTPKQTYDYLIENDIIFKLFFDSKNEEYALNYVRYLIKENNASINIILNNVGYRNLYKTLLRYSLFKAANYLRKNINKIGVELFE